MPLMSPALLAEAADLAARDRVRRRLQEQHDYMGPITSALKNMEAGRRQRQQDAIAAEQQQYQRSQDAYNRQRQETLDRQARADVAYNRGRDARNDAIARRDYADKQRQAARTERRTQETHDQSLEKGELGMDDKRQIMAKRRAEMEALKLAERVKRQTHDIKQTVERMVLAGSVKTPQEAIQKLVQMDAYEPEALDAANKAFISERRAEVNHVLDAQLKSAQAEAAQARAMSAQAHAGLYDEQVNTERTKQAMNNRRYRGGKNGRFGPDTSRIGRSGMPRDFNTGVRISPALREYFDSDVMQPIPADAVRDIEATAGAEALRLRRLVGSGKMDRATAEAILDVWGDALYKGSGKSRRWRNLSGQQLLAQQFKDMDDFNTKGMKAVRESAQAMAEYQMIMQEMVDRGWTTGKYKTAFIDLWTKYAPDAIAQFTPETSDKKKWINDIRGTTTNYMKAISGAAISDRERKWLMSLKPDPRDNTRLFVNNWVSTMRRYNVLMRQRAIEFIESGGDPDIVLSTFDRMLGGKAWRKTMATAADLTAMERWNTDKLASGDPIMLGGPQDLEAAISRWDSKKRGPAAPAPAPAQMPEPAAKAGWKLRRPR